MARVQTVKAARKEGLVCGRCREAIPVGSGYRHFKLNMFTGRHIRCMKPECAPAAWELVSNAKTAALLQAESILDDARAADSPLDTVEFLRDAIAMVEEVKDEVESAVSAWQGTNLEYAERTQNWEGIAGELEDWLSSAEEWASTLESLAENAESFDVDDDDCTDECEDWRRSFDDAKSEIEGIPECDW